MSRSPPRPFDEAPCAGLVFPGVRYVVRLIYARMLELCLNVRSTPALTQHTAGLFSEQPPRHTHPNIEKFRCAGRVQMNSTGSAHADHLMLINTLSPCSNIKE